MELVDDKREESFITWSGLPQVAASGELSSMESKLCAREEGFVPLLGELTTAETSSTNKLVSFLNEDFFVIPVKDVVLASEKSFFIFLFNFKSIVTSACGCEFLLSKIWRLTAGKEGLAGRTPGEEEKVLVRTAGEEEDVVGGTTEEGETAAGRIAQEEEGVAGRDILRLCIESRGTNLRSLATDMRSAARSSSRARMCDLSLSI